MIGTLQSLLLLLAVTAGVEALATRLAVPPSILLVIIGVVLALIPGLPAVNMAPELVLLIVLPLLIYSAGVAMSWKEFRVNIGAITLLAVGCVLFTTAAVATACHLWLHLPWPVGFVLGAIVSPPDAVAPLAVARRMRIPRRIEVILEGEGLANDATALVLTRFAVIAVSAGSVSVGSGSEQFVAIVAGEILWGIVVGWVMLRLRHWARDPHIEITLSVLTPFLAFWPPEHLGGSGVLATVACGLFTSWNGPGLISATTRLQGIFFWDFLTYIVEGLVFLVTGMQARAILSGIHDYSAPQLVLAAGIVSVVVIVARFAWIFPATYASRFGWRGRVTQSEPVSWQRPFAVAFIGIRGVVSLAAALALPLVTRSGAPFPARDLILFLAYAVILVTLVGQGLALPAVIRALGLANAGRREQRAERAAELKARHAAISEALQQLDRLAAERGLPEDVVQSVRSYYRERLRQVEHRASDDEHLARVRLRDEVEFLLIEAERRYINRLYREGQIKDDSRRQVERGYDLREAHLRSVGSED